MLISAENCNEFLAKIAVAPYVGAWIETDLNVDVTTGEIVAPYVGAWIETKTHAVNSSVRASLPTWERGLKHVKHFFYWLVFRRSLRGSVD